MPLTIRTVAVFPFLTLAFLPGAAPAQTAEQSQRIAASFVIALGRMPAPSEAEQWAKRSPQELADLVEEHGRRLQGDRAAARAVMAKAAEDAFGRAAAEGETKGGTKGAPLYGRLVRQHLERLAAQPAEYQAVLGRAYRLVLLREPHAVELDYWKRQPVLPFALVAASLEDWARRNRPGLMATAGVPAVSVHSRYLATVVLSPGVAAEARALTGSGPEEDRALAAAAGRNVVGPGGNGVVSVGGIHFAAAGAPGLVPSDRMDR